MLELALAYCSKAISAPISSSTQAKSKLVAGGDPHEEHEAFVRPVTKEGTAGSV
jgi:hypothetical protein